MSTPAALLDPPVADLSAMPSVDPMVDLPCVGRADLYFAEAPADIEQAKAMCGACPLQTACLDGALERGEVAGVWGGQLLVGGEIVARKRPRGRPRKHPVPPAA